MFGKFFKVAPPSPPGSAYLWRRITAKDGEVLTLGRVVPTTTGMRGYYAGAKGHIRAIDRTGVTRIAREDADRVWLA